jgi:hypothetical protein
LRFLGSRCHRDFAPCTNSQLFLPLPPRLSMGRRRKGRNKAGTSTTSFLAGSGLQEPRHLLTSPPWLAREVSCHHHPSPV